MMAGLRNFNSKEARSVAAAQFGSYFAYHAASILIGKYVLGALYSSITSSITGDDDEEEEQKFTDWDKIKANALWDMAFGSPAPAALDQLAKWFIFNKLNKAQEIWGDPDEEFNQYTDSPLFYPAKSDAMWKTLGAGPGIAELGQMSIDAAEAYSIYYAAEQQNEALTEEELFKINMYTLNIAADLTGAMTIIPLRGDLRRLFKGYAKERKDRARAEQEAMKGRFDFSGTNLDGTVIEPEEVPFIDFSDLETWTEEPIENQ
jgi:hypothetical protein